LADFDEAVRLAPQSSDNYLFRADVRRRIGDNDGAKADQDKAMELMSSEQLRN
jgi:Tfp pilus assembly protein PilF